MFCSDWPANRITRNLMTVSLRLAGLMAVAGSAAALAVASPSFALDNDGSAAIRSLENAATSGSTDLAIDVLPASTVDHAEGSGTTAVDKALLSPGFASLTAAVADQDAPGALSESLECLAGATYFEAKGEPLEGQLAVAEVILNRTRSGRYPSSICGVVHQPGQFSFVKGGRMPAINRDSRAWREAVAIAQIAEDALWESSASEAMAFHARRLSPGWRMKRVTTIGNHVFYR